MFHLFKYKYKGMQPISQLVDLLQPKTLRSTNTKRGVPSVAKYAPSGRRGRVGDPLSLRRRSSG